MTEDKSLPFLEGVFAVAPENRNYSGSNQPQQTEPVSGGHVACCVANLTPFLSGVLVSSLHPDPGRVFSSDADLLAG